MSILKPKRLFSGRDFLFFFLNTFNTTSFQDISNSLPNMHHTRVRSGNLTPPMQTENENELELKSETSFIRQIF